MLATKVLGTMKLAKHQGARDYSFDATGAANPLLKRTLQACAVKWVTKFGIAKPFTFECTADNNEITRMCRWIYPRPPKAQARRSSGINPPSQPGIWVDRLFTLVATWNVQPLDSFLIRWYHPGRHSNG